jgi:MFS transporter, AAHS family, 4-hydroxybenzoate transporter
VNSFQPSAVDSRYGNLPLRITWLCALALVLEGYDIGAMGYTIPALSHAWHLRPVAFTPALTAGSVGLFAGSLLCGWLGDRFGRKTVLVGCVAMFGVMSLLTATVATSLWLTIVRFGTGIGLGGGIPTSITLLSDFSPPRKQGGLVILMTCGVTVGNVVGGIAAARLIVPFGWNSVFVVGGIAPLLLLPLIVLFLPESSAFLASRRHPHETEASSIISAVPAEEKNPVGKLFSGGFAGLTTLLWTINFFSLLTIYFINSWLPSILHSAGATTQSAIITTTMYHVGGIAGAFISGATVARFGVERVFAVLLTVAAACLLLIGLTTTSILVIGCLVFGSGIGISASQLGINSLPGAMYPPAIRSTGTGWAIGVGRLGNIVGPLFGGLLLSLSWSPKHMFLALCAPVIILIWMLLVLDRVRGSHPLDLTSASATGVPVATD